MGTYPGGMIVRVTPTLSESAYTALDVLFNPTEVKNAVSSRGGVSALTAMFVVDYKNVSDTDARFIFTEGNTDFGTINATANISTDNIKANKVIGTALWSQTAATTATGIDNARVHQVLQSFGTSEYSSPMMLVQAAAGSRSIYVSGLLASSTTPTYDADSIELIMHFKYLG